MRFDKTAPTQKGTTRIALRQELECPIAYPLRVGASVLGVVRVAGYSNTHSARRVVQRYGHSRFRPKTP